MPENQKPILDPEHELPTPHDMELNPGYEAQLGDAKKANLPPGHNQSLPKPGFFFRYKFLVFLLPVILLIGSAAFAVYIVSNARQKEQSPRPTAMAVPTERLQPTARIETNYPSPSSLFCGGIAAIQCPAGYSCKLDGNYPDAGGHCVAGSGGIAKPTSGQSTASEETIDAAKDDLTQRTGKDDEIQVVSITEQEWRDSSLGCPKPGMMYLQVITPGYLIVLSDGTKEYNYHTDQGTRAVLCDN